MPGVCWIQNWGHFDVRWHTIHWQVITLLLAHFFEKATPLISWITAPCRADALMLHTAVVGGWICLTAMLKLCTLACRKNLHLYHPTPGKWLSSCSTTDCPVYCMAALALPKHLHHIRSPLTENGKAIDVASHLAHAVVLLYKHEPRPTCLSWHTGLLSALTQAWFDWLHDISCIVFIKRVMSMHSCLPSPWYSKWLTHLYVYFIGFEML
jgi:hypothetical protein